jgi:hypothetical protein
MSNNNQDWLEELDEDFDLEYEFDEEPQRGRRGTPDDALKKVRRAERAKEKRIKELESELSSLRKFQRDSVVQSVLNEKGVNTKVASFIPSDLETTPEAINSWLEQNAEVFGIQLARQESVLNEQDIDVLRQIDGATSNALSVEASNDIMSMIANASSADEIMEMIYGSE